MVNYIDLIINIGMIILLTIVLAIIIGILTYFYFKVKRYRQYKCIIFERDGLGQIKQIHDWGGIFHDSATKHKLLFLQKHQIGLNPDHLPYLSDSKGKKTVYLYKTGQKNFHFIKININEPKITMQVGEEDVNWAAWTYEKTKKRFADSVLMQYMPYIALFTVSIVVLIVCIYLLKEVPGIMTTLESISKNNAIASSGTIITGG